MNGSTTESVAATATAASTALPPAWSARSPAWVASGWFEATAPRRPMISGRCDRGPSYAMGPSERDLGRQRTAARGREERVGQTATVQPRVSGTRAYWMSTMAS